MGTSGRAWRAASSAASTSAGVAPSEGAYRASTPSTPGSATSTATACSTSAPLASRPRSTTPSAPTTCVASPDNAAWVPAASSLSRRPEPIAASAAIASDPPALPTTATRRPGGRGWLVRRRAVSSIAESVGTRMTPVCSRRAASVASWPTDASEVGSRPAFTVTTGLARVRRRASRLKCRGFPRLSMYMHTTAVLSSPSQYWSRSLPDTSERFPRATKEEIPIPRSRA